MTPTTPIVRLNPGIKILARTKKRKRTFFFRKKRSKATKSEFFLQKRESWRKFLSFFVALRSSLFKKRKRSEPQVFHGGESEAKSRLANLYAWLNLILDLLSRFSNPVLSCHEASSRQIAPIAPRQGSNKKPEKAASCRVWTRSLSAPVSYSPVKKCPKMSDSTQTFRACDLCALFVQSCRNNDYYSIKVSEFIIELSRTSLQIDGLQKSLGLSYDS